MTKASKGDSSTYLLVSMLKLIIGYEAWVPALPAGPNLTNTVLICGDNFALVTNISIRGMGSCIGQSAIERGRVLCIYEFVPTNKARNMFILLNNTLHQSHHTT